MPGTYALLLYLAAPQSTTVGALGQIRFPAGWYLYLGSALGPGGLPARLDRHRRRDGKRLHWHIDYLRALGTLAEIWTHTSERRQECRWARAAARWPGARGLVPGFGASDCRCVTHLFHYQDRPAPGHLEAHIDQPLQQQVIQGVGPNP